MRISKWVLDDQDEIEFKDAEAVNQTDGELNDTIVTYEGNTSDVQSWTDFIASFVNGMKIGKFFKNLYAGIQYVLHVGSLVNNCVTDNSDLPLSAAQGKVLMDELTQVKSDLSELAGIYITDIWTTSCTLKFGSAHAILFIMTTAYVGIVMNEWQTITKYGDSSLFNMLTITADDSSTISIISASGSFKVFAFCNGTIEAE